MKIVNNYIAGAVLGAACFCTGCDNKLDGIQPHNVNFEEQQFSTPQGFTRATVANYDDFCLNAADRDWLNLSEFKGNNIRVVAVTSTSTAMDAQNVDAFTYTNASSKDFGLSHKFWAANYKVMLGVNTVLKHVAEGEKDATILQAKAENLFLRAVINFNLVRLYGMPYYQSPSTNLGVPLILRPIVSVSEQPARATVEATYKQIIDDLQGAIASFTTRKNNSFATRYGAYAMLSRVYLYMSGRIEDPNTQFAALAAQYADSVIMNGGYTLLQGNTYVNSFNNTNRPNAETIWAVNKDVKTTSIPILLYRPTGSLATDPNYNTGQFKPSPDLMALIASNDLRRNLFMTEKFPGNNIDTLSTTKYRYKYVQVNNSAAPVNYLRLAEVFLNRAEARLKAGNPGGALNDLNEIRRRAGIGEAIGLTGKPLFDEILKQRRIELAFEGHNSFDDFRNGIAMVRTYSSFNSPAMTIQPNDPKVVLRISDDVMIENRNMKQNIQ